MILILLAYEAVRAAVRPGLFGLKEPSIPRTVFGAACHVAAYLWLFAGVYFYTILPIVVVVVKHAVNFKSTNYVVAQKAAPGGGGKSSDDGGGGGEGPTLPISVGGGGRPMS